MVFTVFRDACLYEIILEFWQIINRSNLSKIITNSRFLQKFGIINKNIIQRDTEIMILSDRRLLSKNSDRIDNLWCSHIILLIGKNAANLIYIENNLGLYFFTFSRSLKNELLAVSGANKAANTIVASEVILFPLWCLCNIFKRALCIISRDAYSIVLNRYWVKRLTYFNSDVAFVNGVKDSRLAGFFDGVSGVLKIFSIYGSRFWIKREHKHLKNIFSYLCLMRHDD